MMYAMTDTGKIWLQRWTRPSFYFFFSASPTSEIQEVLKGTEWNCTDSVTFFQLLMCRPRPCLQTVYSHRRLKMAVSILRAELPLMPRYITVLSFSFLGRFMTFWSFVCLFSKMGVDHYSSTMLLPLVPTWERTGVEYTIQKSIKISRGWDLVILIWFSHVKRGLRQHIQGGIGHTSGPWILLCWAFKASRKLVSFPFLLLSVIPWGSAHVLNL